jgi:hypothetical protein
MRAQIIYTSMGMCAMNKTGAQMCIVHVYTRIINEKF